MNRENGVGGVLKSLSSSLDSEEYNETSQENQQVSVWFWREKSRRQRIHPDCQLSICTQKHLSSRFAALEEVGHEMESPPDAGLMEGLPLVCELQIFPSQKQGFSHCSNSSRYLLDDGRAKRVKRFRRKEVNTFKREEAEVIEYQKVSLAN